MGPFSSKKRRESTQTPSAKKNPPPSVKPTVAIRATTERQQYAPIFTHSRLSDSMERSLPPHERNNDFSYEGLWKQLEQVSLPASTVSLPFSPTTTPPLAPETPVPPPVTQTTIPTPAPITLASPKNETGVLVYVLGVSQHRISFFIPTRSQAIVVERSLITTTCILKPAEIYLATDAPLDSAPKWSSVTLTAPSALRRDQYLNRSDSVYDSLTDYRTLILPALLLGCRVRDFEQRCATVVSVQKRIRPQVVLSIPAQKKNGVELRLKKLELRTVSGEYFELDVRHTETKDGDKRWRVFCRLPDALLADVRKDAALELLNGEERPVRVTTVLEEAYMDPYAEERKYFLEDAWPALSRIYGETGRLFHGAIHTTDVTVRNKNGDIIRLNREQSQAVGRYNSDCRAFVVEAPPGSGKTLTAAAMAVSYWGRGVQLFLSTANVPVANMAKALGKLDLGRRSALHLVSQEFDEKMDSPFTPRSLIKADEHASRELRELEWQLAFAPSQDEKTRIRKRIRELHARFEKLRYFDVIFGTVDMLLGRRFGRDADHLSDAVTRVVVDEASILTEAALNALILAFPTAQLVLIGDSKQLQPYKYERGDVASELAARPALQAAIAKEKVHRVELQKVYRAAPLLIAHYSNVFYSGLLKSQRVESPTNPLACLKQGDARCLFWEVWGTTRQVGTSMTNQEEADALIYLVKKLRQWDIDGKSVMIICYYDAQRKLAAQRLSSAGLKGYEVLTVDSAQGRENRVVIVLTTRTTAKEGKKKFFSSPLRCNVAVSRHQEALIVIGYPCIESVPNWEEVLSEKYFTHVNGAEASR